MKIRKNKHPARFESANFGRQGEKDILLFLFLFFLKGVFPEGIIVTMTIFSRKLAPTRSLKNGSHRIERMKSFNHRIIFKRFLSGDKKKEREKKKDQTLKSVDKNFFFSIPFPLKKREKESKGVLRFKWYHQNNQFKFFLTK